MVTQNESSEVIGNIDTPARRLWYQSISTLSPSGKSSRPDSFCPNPSTATPLEMSLNASNSLPQTSLRSMNIFIHPPNDAGWSYVHSSDLFDFFLGGTRVEGTALPILSCLDGLQGLVQSEVNRLRKPGSTVPLLQLVDNLGNCDALRHSFDAQGQRPVYHEFHKNTAGSCWTDNASRMLEDNPDEMSEKRPYFERVGSAVATQERKHGKQYSPDNWNREQYTQHNLDWHMMLFQNKPAVLEEYWRNRPSS